MDAARLIRTLELQIEPMVRAFEAVEPTDLARRPTPRRWAPVEILGHLLDEERLDFRVRIEATLEDPAASWTPIDPEGWVDEHDYLSLDAAETLASLRAERAESIRRMRALEAPDWSRAHEHPELGRLRAGDLLTAWAVHDLQHLRQLATTQVAHLRADAAPYVSDYSGGE